MRAQRLALIAVSSILFFPPAFLVRASPPPPARYPQACARTFCVEIIPQSPYELRSFSASSQFGHSPNSLVAQLSGGAVVAFYAVSVRGTSFPAGMEVPKWDMRSHITSSAACLVCTRTNESWLEVIGIGVAGLPPESKAEFLRGSDVCYWPLRMDAAGYGSGQMKLGEKVCAKM